MNLHWFSMRGAIERFTRELIHLLDTQFEVYWTNIQVTYLILFCASWVQITSTFRSGVTFKRGNNFPTRKGHCPCSSITERESSRARRPGLCKWHSNPRERSSSKIRDSRRCPPSAFQFLRDFKCFLSAVEALTLSMRAIQTHVMCRTMPDAVAVLYF